MTFLSPLGLLWLFSIPVLVWLWRMSATRRQIQVPSLIPFERLLKRPPRRRTRLVVNVLFWLQLAALIGLALALARPVIVRRRARTVLAVLDTSASMSAGRRGSSAFERARQALLAAVAGKSPAEQWFLMTTSPVAPLTPQPTSDGVALARALHEVRASHLGGNLSTTARIGRALLTADPDETFVATDEPRPKEFSGNGVRWVTVGAPMANVAIVGLDAQGPLCAPADARVIATVQNFDDAPSSVSMAATQAGRRIAGANAELSPHARQSLSLGIPEGTEGWVEIALTAENDGLEADNRAWIDLRRNATLPVVIRSQSPAFTRTVSAWLAACPALTWTLNNSPPGKPWDEGQALLITDHEDDTLSSAAAAMVFVPPSAPRPVLSHWVVSADHPIGSYLAPVEVVAASLNLTAETAAPGLPVVSGLVHGRKFPIVVADEREGHRVVSILLDPSGSDRSTPVLLAFFNSLRWLMGGSESQATGEPLTVSGLKPGPVRVRRPDGFAEILSADGGTFRYDATILAGPYRFSQGSSEVTAAVNFFNPLESNLADRASTWGVAPLPPASPGSSRQAAHPLSNVVMGMILVAMMIEWWRYCARRA